MPRTVIKSQAPGPPPIKTTGLDESDECAEEVMKIDYRATMTSQHLLGLVP